jgi:hypothetical protein
MVDFSVGRIVRLRRMLDENKDAEREGYRVVARESDLEEGQSVLVSACCKRGLPTSVR